MRTLLFQSLQVLCFVLIGGLGIRRITHERAQSLASLLKFVKIQRLGTWYFDFTHQTPLREKPISSSLETHWSEHRVSLVLSFSCSICSMLWGVLQIELTARKTQSHFNSWLCWVWGLPNKESPIVCLLKNNLKMNLLLPIFLYK